MEIKSIQQNPQFDTEKYPDILIIDDVVKCEKPRLSASDYFDSIKKEPDLTSFSTGTHGSFLWAPQVFIVGG